VEIWRDKMTARDFEGLKENLQIVNVCLTYPKKKEGNSGYEEHTEYFGVFLKEGKEKEFEDKLVSLVRENANLDFPIPNFMHVLCTRDLCKRYQTTSYAEVVTYAINWMDGVEINKVIPLYICYPFF
jgi:hypothetical protein